jgi:hypothetical protein
VAVTRSRNATIKRARVLAAQVACAGRTLNDRKRSGLLSGQFEREL